MSLLHRLVARLTGRARQGAGRDVTEKQRRGITAYPPPSETDRKNAEAATKTVVPVKIDVIRDPNGAGWDR